MVKLSRCNSFKDRYNFINEFDKNPVNALKVYYRYFPEIVALRGLIQSPVYHPEGDVYTHTESMLAMNRLPMLWFKLAILLHDIGKPVAYELIDDKPRFYGHENFSAQMVPNIMKKFWMPEKDIMLVQWLVQNHMVFLNINNYGRKNQLKLFSHPYFPYLLELHRLDCLGSNGKFDICPAFFKIFSIF